MGRLHELLEHWKSAPLSLVALLVVIPALINALVDVWHSMQDLPVGTKEEVNSHLFRKHFQENPIHSKEFVIDGNRGKLPMRMDVYADGDIFVDYGLLPQWFPYDPRQISRNHFGLISPAFAADYRQWNAGLSSKP